MTNQSFIRKVGYNILKSKQDTKKLNLDEQQIREWILCRQKPLYYIYNYVKFEITGGLSDYKSDNNFHPKLKRFVRCAHLHHNALLMASRQLGKALAIDTLIPTAHGTYKELKDIKVGDLILDGEGNPTKVIATTDIMYDRPCYRINFDNNDSITTDENHIWKVSNSSLKFENKLITTKGIYHQLTFATNKHYVFNLKRNRENLVFMSSIEKVNSVPVKCIEVENQDGMFLCGHSMIPTHNSTISAALLDWAIRFYPKNTAIILNFKKETALENLKKIKFINSELPDFLKLDFFSKSDIKSYADYSNGSSIKTYYPTTIHSKDTIARSLTAPILYIDEAAFITDMREVFGSAQPILSTARGQAIKNSYPFMILITSTPNGTQGDGEWFYDRYQNAIDTDFLFDNDERWVKNFQEIISDPSKNSFLKTRFHWSEDPKKDDNWYVQQCRELSDKRKINQELDLIFVGTSNCIFEDDLLSQFRSKKPVDLVRCPHETNLIVYNNDLNKNDYYIIGVDTARSLSGAYNSIEIFSFLEFKQIAEFNYRIGSFTKYGEIIDAIFRWLYKKVGQNIILAIENNTIGLAPIEHLLAIKDIDYATYIYKEKQSVNPGKIKAHKKGPIGEEWGISTTGISKDHMIGCLTEIIKEDPTVIKSQALINQLSAIERTRGGNISSDTFSDLFMASCFCAYVRKMKAFEIMPLIKMGREEFTKQSFDTFRSLIESNTKQTDIDIKNAYLFVEDEIEQLIKTNASLLDGKEEYFSPFI